MNTESQTFEAIAMLFFFVIEIVNDYRNGSLHLWALKQIIRIIQ